MGMYTAVANGDQWLETFGVDVEEIDQWEIVRRTEHAGAGGVHYDDKELTPALLERQVRTYYAMRELTTPLYEAAENGHAEVTRGPYLW